MGRKYLTAPIERLHQLFEVRDGKLYRGGKEAGGLHNAGYRRVRVDGMYYLSHRVIFALTHGRWPEADVDHKDRQGLNNDPTNLREATHHDNMRNGSLRCNNTSGVPGVSWDSERSKWAVSICYNGKTHHFGRHDDLEFAELVAHEARHRLFGAFAPVLN